jgi:acyl-CoA thioesterase I
MELMKPARLALGAAALTAGLSLSVTVANSEIMPGQSCAVPAGLLRSSYGLPHVAAKLRAGQPIKIVTLGSSSTEGVGASSVAANYPSRMLAELQQLWPKNAITVLNKGVSGEQAHQMMARFERDVIDQKPDLVVWQTGTNSALHHSDLERFIADVDHGIDRARDAGIDVLLMTPQYSPKFEAVFNKHAYLHNIATIGAVNRVPVFRRYEAMKHWQTNGQMTADDMINADGLHLTDQSYYCLGVLTARMIAGLATPSAEPALPALSVSAKRPLR